MASGHLGADDGLAGADRGVAAADTAAQQGRGAGPDVGDRRRRPRGTGRAVAPVEGVTQPAVASPGGRCGVWIFAARRTWIGSVDYIGSDDGGRSEEHTSELQSLMRKSYAGFCMKKNTNRAAEA